jgi:hypothetical protein
MADISDALTLLTNTIAGIVYPNGTASPSITGAGIRIYPGWPIGQQLDIDLAAGVCHVSVFPSQQERNTTRYLGKFEQTSVNTPTLTLTVVGQMVTVGGVIPPASNVHNLGVFVNGIPYVYQALPTDTLASIAAALAALIVVAVPGTSTNGPTITVPKSATLGAARVGVFGSSSKPVRNQDRVVQITIWADTPANRDTIAKAVDPVLAAMNFLVFPDDTAGRFIYRGSPFSDQFEKSGLYRRDLMYSVDFSTLAVVTSPQIVAVETNTSAALNGVPPFVPVSTTFN